MKFVAAKHLIPCESDSCRVSLSEVVTLSLYGPTTAVRSNWAYLVGGDNRGFYVFDDYVKLPESYSTIQTKIGLHNSHIIMVNDSATNHVSPYADHYFLIGPNCKEKYFARFSRMCKVPLRLQWKDALWQHGIDSDLIQPLEGWGVEAYKVYPDRKPHTEVSWERVIKKCLLSGELT